VTYFSSRVNGFKGLKLEVDMRNGLCSKLLVLYFLLLTACDDINISDVSDVDDTNKKNQASSEIKQPKQTKVSGKIMLGPVVRGHSLQLVIYDTDRNELAKPKVDYNGSYSFLLEDYKGIIFSQVTSTNPDQCSGDYIDEATADTKCLGNNTILSSTYLQSGTSNNQAMLYTTPVTTVAVIHAGVGLDSNGQLIIPKELTQYDIEKSNKAVAKVFGLGDQSVAEYTPTSIITTDQKFQVGDAYTNALAAISGVEAEGKELNSIVKQISKGISTDDNTPSLDPAVQDMIVTGTQRVAETIKANSGDKTILKNLTKYQKKFPKSIIAVDLSKDVPESPKFNEATKQVTRNTKPTWDWTPKNSETVTYFYEYRTGENDRSWKKANTSRFTPNEDYKEGLHTLIVRQADERNPKLWSKPSKSTIKILSQVITPKTKPPEAKEPIKNSPEAKKPKANPPEVKKPETIPPKANPPKVKKPETIPPKANPPEVKKPENKPPEAEEPENIISNDLPNIISNITSIPPAMEDHNYSLELLIEDTDNEEITIKFINRWSPLWLTFSNGKKTITLTKKNNLFSEKLIGDPWYEDIGINEFTLRINENKPDQKDFSFEIEVKESTTKFKVELIGTPKQNQTLKFKLINEDQKEEGTFSYYWMASKTGERTYGETYTLTQQDVGQLLFLVCEYNEKDSGKSGGYFLQTETVVEDVDEPPQIANMPNLTANIGEIYKFKPNVIDPDADQNFHFTINKIPLWATFNTNDGTLSGTPEIDDAAMTEDIVITVTDSTGLIGTTEPFDIQVHPFYFNERANTKINVCWKFFDDDERFLGKDEFSNEYKDLIKKTALQSWHRYSALSFEGWYDCLEDAQSSENSTLQLAIYRDNSEIPMYLPYFHSILLDNQPSKHTIIHEFGHALGFPHEQERMDTFSSYHTNSDSNVCTNIKYPLPTVKSEQYEIFEERKRKNLRLINRKQFQQQQYNPFSVMNYCTRGSDYLANHVNSEKLLSNADINRLQQFYGAPSDTGLHLMDGSEFFTGFYRAKDQTDYVFYKYGAPYNQSRINLSQISDQQYFVIYDKQQNQSVLFKFNNNLQYLKPVNDPIAVCNPLHLPNIPSNDVIPVYCSAVWEHNNYSNNNFYYFDGPYGFKNEFNSLFCEEIEGKPFLFNSITKYFVRMSDHDCMDFNQDIYQPYFLTNIDNQLFIKGKGYSGRLDGLHNLSFENGKLIYDVFEQKNNKLKRFNHKTNSFVDYSGHITEPANNDSLEAGYYSAGTKVNKEDIILVNKSFQCCFNKPDAGYIPADLSGVVTYSFIENDGTRQLFKDGKPFTGIYDGESYINGYLFTL
jgi:hypothetical protein